METIQIGKYVSLAYDIHIIQPDGTQQTVYQYTEQQPDNFVLGKDEITFIYVEDEIAPHATGEIKVVIPYSDLDHILNQKP